MVKWLIVDGFSRFLDDVMILNYLNRLFIIVCLLLLDLSHQLKLSADLIWKFNFDFLAFNSKSSLQLAMTLLRAYELLLRPLMIRLSPLLIDLGTFDNFLFGIDDLIISGYSHHIDPRSVIRIQRQTSSGVVTGWKRSFFVLYFFFSDLSYGSTRQEFQ